jgi:ABC-type sugar transport system permease subunit
MSFDQSFQNNHFGIGSAIAFLLFALIMVLTLLQRRLIPEEID